MLKGFIIGDLIGSTRNEHIKTTTKDDKLFPISSSITFQTINAISSFRALTMDNDFKTYKNNLIENLLYFGNKYLEYFYNFDPEFTSWLFTQSNNIPYLKNASHLAIICPIAYLNKNLYQSLSLCEDITRIFTKDCDSIVSSKAFITAMSLAKQKVSKEHFIKEMKIYYNLENKIENVLHLNYSSRNITYKILLCLINSEDFVDCMRNGLYMQFDSISLSVLGMLAEAYYNLPLSIELMSKKFLKDEFLEFFLI